MFERYTETARRVVFYARYEASIHGTREIDSRCLLLGILREDRELLTRFLPGNPHELYRLWTGVEDLFPKSPGQVPTNIDLPLSHAALRALTAAAKQAENLRHQSIEPRHVLWGLLKAEGPEAACLKSCGIEVEAVDADLKQIPAETALLERHAVRRLVDGLPKERLQAASFLLTCLASKHFDVSGTGPAGPFHFSFGDKPE
jgi:ATP-dependent Clp protease ATP-binding subunit ClpC